MFTTAFSKTTVLVESQRYSGKPTFYKDHEVTPGFREPTCSSQAKDIVINCRGMPTLYLTYIYMNIYNTIIITYNKSQVIITYIYKYIITGFTLETQWPMHLNPMYKRI